MRGLKLHYWKNLPKKSSVRDHKMSGGKDSRRNINQGLFEVVSKNTFSNLKDHFVSNIFLRPKQDSQFHPTRSLKKLKNFIPYFHFKIENFKQVKHLLRQSHLMEKDQAYNLLWRHLDNEENPSGDLDKSRQIHFLTPAFMVCHLKNKTASRTKNIIELLVVNMTVYLQEKRITKLSNLRKNLLKEKSASLKELPSLIPNRKLDFPYIKQSFWHLFNISHCECNKFWSYKRFYLRKTE